MGKSKRYNSVRLQGVEKMVKELNKLSETPDKIVHGTLASVKRNGSKWLAPGVAKIYNIGKKDVGSGRLGTFRITYAKSVGESEIKLEGRRLTPVHFGMKPARPNGQDAHPNPYTLTYKVKKKGRKFSNEVKTPVRGKTGSRKSKQSPWMLMSTGNTKMTGVDYIPFQRRANPGKLAFVNRTVSLPQMVTKGEDGPMHDEVREAFEKGLEAQFQHQIKKYW